MEVEERPRLFVPHPCHIEGGTGERFPPRRKLGFVSLGSSTTGRRASEDEEMLAEDSAADPSGRPNVVVAAADDADPDHVRCQLEV